MKKKITTWLDQNQLAWLRKVSKETGAPVAELIRRAIDAYMKKAR